MSKMKLFKIVADRYSYDQFDSAVVACESKEKLQKLIDEGAFYGESSWYWCKEDGLSLFVKNQQLSIEEIDLDKIEDTKIILSSFNAG